LKNAWPYGVDEVRDGVVDLGRGDAAAVEPCDARRAGGAERSRDRDSGNG